MILAFAHPGIVVPDLEKAIAFYSAMFGFEKMSDEGWSNNPEMDKAAGLTGAVVKGCLMKGHNCHLELWQYSKPAQAGPPVGGLLAHELGIRHLAFYVDDCRAEYQRLIDLGGLELGQPIGEPGAGSVVYCQDPFGNIIELAEMPSLSESSINLPGVSSLGKFPEG